MSSPERRPPYEGGLFTVNMHDIARRPLMAIAEGRKRTIGRPDVSRLHLNVEQLVPPGVTDFTFTCYYSLGGHDPSTYNIGWRTADMASVVPIPVLGQPFHFEGTVIAHRSVETMQRHLVESRGFTPEHVAHVLAGMPG